MNVLCVFNLRPMSRRTFSNIFFSIFITPLNASVALLEKPVNWFTKQNWFLYEGNTDI